MSDEPFIVRQANPADAERIAGLFRLVYQQTSHPCTDTENVRAGFANGEKWLVCEQEDNCVACTALVPHHWNATYEIARAARHPTCEGQKLGWLLLRDTLTWANELGELDYVVGWPRSVVICRILCMKISPPMLLFGHDGGANIAHGRRERHAFGMARTLRQCQRAEPMFGPGTLSFFEERISQLDFDNIAASPPPEVLVGPKGEHTYQSSQGASFRYLRTETSAGWSVLVTESQCEPKEIDQLLACFLADHSAVRHIACYVLWDKTDLIARLGFLGFQATAYLPGWYLRDGLRHDCILLSWLARGESVVDNGTEDLLQPIEEALAGFAEFRAAEQLLRPLSMA